MELDLRNVENPMMGAIRFPYNTFGYCNSVAGINAMHGGV